MIEVRIHGYGGQGAVTLANLLMQAVTNHGSHSQALPFFGVERRGAPVRAVVRISDAPIRVHSQHCVADLLVVMNDSLYDIATADLVREGATILINTHQPGRAAVDNSANIVTIDAAKIARDNGLGAHPAAVNVPLYAACCSLLKIPEAIMIHTLFDKWSGEIGNKNVRAGVEAYATALKTSLADTGLCHNKE